jgi:hypothetical protein
MEKNPINDECAELLSEASRYAAHQSSCKNQYQYQVIEINVMLH